MQCRSIAKLSLSSVSCLALLAVASGCSWSPRARFAAPYVREKEKPIVMAPVVEQHEFNAVSLSELPAGVQTAFHRTHPQASITAVQQVPSGAGPMLYRVSFMDGGVASTTMYEAAGSESNPSYAGTVLRADDSGRPAAKYAPNDKPQSAGIPGRGTVGAFD